MVLAEKRQGIRADWKVYPKIRNADELAECLRGRRVIEACGFRTPSRRSGLKALLDRAEKERSFFLVDDAGHSAPSDIRLPSRIAGSPEDKSGLTVLLKDTPSGWPTGGVLLCTEGMQGRRADRLMEKLYDRDCVILGLIPEEILEEALRQS